MHATCTCTNYQRRPLVLCFGQSTANGIFREAADDEEDGEDADDVDGATSAVEPPSGAMSSGRLRVSRLSSVPPDLECCLLVSPLPPLELILELCELLELLAEFLRAFISWS